MGSPVSARGALFAVVALSAVVWSAADVHDGSKCSDGGNDCCAHEVWGEPKACSDGYVAIPKLPEKAPWCICPEELGGCACYGCYPPGTQDADAAEVASRCRDQADQHREEEHREEEAHRHYGCPIGGVVAGIIVMIAVMVSCCVGLRMQPKETGDAENPQGAKPIKLPFHFSKGCVCLWFCPIILLLLLHIGSLGLFIAMPDYCYAHAYMLHGPAVGHYMVVYGPVLGWFGLNFLVVFLIWMFCCKAPPKAVTQQAPPPAQLSEVVAVPADPTSKEGS